MRPTSKRFINWLRAADLLSKLWSWIKKVWFWGASVTGPIVAYLSGVDWQLVCSVVLFFLFIVAGVCEWRERFRMVRDANARANRYKQDMNRTWFQSRSFALDPNKRKKVAVSFVGQLFEEEAQDIAAVFQNNGWAVLGPTMHQSTLNNPSHEHTALLEIRDYSPYSEDARRYGPAISCLTGHKVHTVDAEALETKDELKALGVPIRITVYANKSA